MGKTRYTEKLGSAHIVELEVVELEVFGCKLGCLVRTCRLGQNELLWMVQEHSR